MPANNGHPWESVAEPVRGELLAFYEEIVAETGCCTPLALRWAKMAAETWATASSVSQESAVLALRRRLGRGRRPTRSVVSQAAKRQALELDSADKALRTLRDLAGRDGNGNGGDFAAKMAAAHRQKVTDGR